MRSPKLPMCLSPRSLSIAAALFVAFWAFVHVVVTRAHVSGARWLGESPWWPQTVFVSTPPGVAKPAVLVGLAGVFTAVFVALAPRIVRARGSLLSMIAVGFAAALASNALEGVPSGYERPVAGMDFGGIQYHHDALEIASVEGFLRDFTSRQPTLRTHSRTHPPGAVLLYLPSIRLGIPPRVTGPLLCLFAFLLTGLSVGGIARTVASAEASGFVVLLLLLAPASQIYGCSTMDAVFAGFVWTAIAGAVDGRPRSVALASIGLFAASLLSFAVPFAVAVMVCVELVALRRFPRASAIAVVATVLGLFALRAATGFDWVESLRVATRIENPTGPLYQVDPWRYLGSRLQDVAEFLLFAGPVLLLYAGAGFRRPWPIRSPAFVASVASLLSLSALLLAGAFTRAETARIWQFVTPALVLPAAQVVEQADDEPLVHASGLVYLQTIVMQLVGDYFW